MKYNKLTITLISLGLLASNANASNTDVDETIEVTANRTQQEQFLSLSSTQVISQADIEAIQPLNVTDLLDKVAGISVVNQGGAGQSSSIFMRGTNSDHTLILIDGVRVGSATLGTANYASMSIAQIERVEIVKGPRAALWGSDAIGGVIQIFTRQFEAGEGYVSAGFGSNSLVKASAGIGLGNQTHSYSVTVASESADGFNAYQTDELPYDINEPDEDGYERLSLSVNGKSIISDTTKVLVSSTYQEGNSEYDASYPEKPCWSDPTAVCAEFYANESDFENYHLRVAGQYQVPQLFAELSVATSQDQGETFGNGIAKADKDRIKTERDQVSFIGQYQFNDNTSLSAGADWYNEKVSTNTDKDAWTPGFQTWQEDERDVSAFYVQARHQLNQLFLEGAVRRDDIENVDNETTYNASIGYQLDDVTLITFNRGTGFKAPTFNDLYWPGSGNPELMPEEVTSNEVLIRSRFASGQIEFSYFDSDVDNLIDWAKNDQGVWNPSNVDEASLEGVELTITSEIGNFNQIFSAAYIEAEDKATGDALPRRPKVTVNYNAGYQWQDFTFNSNLTYRDESEDSSGATLSSYFLVDVTATYQLNSNTSFNAKINNLLDEDYETASNYIADGTNFVLSASYTF